MDAGDYVVVINADKVKLTGNKEAAKEYYRYSGYRADSSPYCRPTS